MKKKTVILFPTSAHVMRAEKLFKVDSISCKLIPVPRNLSSDCGICIVIPSSASTKACALLNAKKVNYDYIALLD